MKKKTSKRRDPSDPARRESEKRGRRADQRKLKKTKVRLGVYYGKNTKSAMKVHRAQLFGVIAVGLDDFERRVPKCLIATVTSSNGRKKSQALRPGSLSFYDWVEEWNINDPAQHEMLKHARDRLRKDKQVRDAAAELLSELIKSDRQAKLFFDGAADVAADSFYRRPEPEPEPKVNFASVKEDTAPKTLKVRINGQLVEGDAEAIRAILGQ